MVDFVSYQQMYSKSPLESDSVPMSEALAQLKVRLNNVHYLNSVNNLLGWDQQTMMPEGAQATRAAQTSTISRLSHEMFSSPEIGALIDTAAAHTTSLSYDSNDAALLRIVQRDYERAVKVPAELVAEISSTAAFAHGAWVQARAENKFELFAPWLEKIVKLNQRLAKAIGYTDHIYDALIDQYEPGMTTANVTAMFADIKREVVPMIAHISQNQGRASDDVLHRFYAEAKQESFTLRLARGYGFDFARGRQDRAVHPFCQSMSPDDVRLTTRYDEHFLQAALFGTLHETGHGLYEQGVSHDLHPMMATGISLGVHESQSRLWENVVGRSRGFWNRFYPELQAEFPESLGDVSLETFYGAINTSKPSFIRVEADEVTYNMHTMLRFEIECDLLTNELSVADAPAAWNSKMQAYLGITPPTDALGILQDVHWSGGMMGYFPTYTIGNLLSAQLYEAATRAVASIPADIEHGQFDTLLAWMRTNIHQYGRNYLPQELVKRATGEPLSSRAYIAYLKAKYGEIYNF